MSKYNATLKNGQEIYIPAWPASVALENLTKAGGLLGSNNLLRISELNYAAAILAISHAADSATAAALIKHFVCEARIEGEKIDKGDYDVKFAEDLPLALEIFCHVIKAQYYDFFKLGLAEETSHKA